VQTVVQEPKPSSAIEQGSTGTYVKIEGGPEVLSKKNWVCEI